MSNTERFILQSAKKYRREGLSSVVRGIDKDSNLIFIDYLNNSNELVEQAEFAYDEYLRELLRTNGLSK